MREVGRRVWWRPWRGVGRCGEGGCIGWIEREGRGVVLMTRRLKGTK
jgi:hypothetical protein